MNIVFVTVGTSAVSNEELWEADSGLRPIIPRDIHGFMNGLEEGEDPPRGFENLLLSAHNAFWNKNNNYRCNRAHRLKTSAEAISTYSARVSQLFELKAGRDKVVLLLSNTTLGQLCGRINKHLIEKYVFATPAENEDVTTETIKLSSPEGFRTVAQDGHPIYPQILRVIEKHLDGNNAEAFFNITGSYKGLIPAITHICTTRYSNRSTILYLHETMDATVTLKPTIEGTAMEEGWRDTPYADLS